MQLETERLILRRWKHSDREPFAALNADPVVMEHYPSTMTREEADAAIDRFEAHFDAHGWGLWAVEVKTTSECIGYTGLWPPNWNPALVEVGWRLAHHAWGNGYAPEAARAAIDDGFSRLGFTEIVSFTTVNNTNSRRVMEKLGMIRDPADDFEHPNVPEGHPIRPHVFYRLKR